MKKNWLQILSLALNVTLLITLLVTRAELVNTRTILKSNGRYRVAAFRYG